MRQIQQRVKQWNADHKDAKETLHAPDGIHLNDLGQLAMGFAIIKGLGAPAEVSSVTVSAREGKALDARGCHVTDVVRSGDRLEFTRLDEGLPLNLEPLWQLHFRFIPFTEELNRYMLAVKDLPPGKYEVRAAGRLVGTYDERQLAGGVNLSSATPDPWQPGGPWAAQSHLVKKLTDARGETRLAALFAPEFLSQNPGIGAAKRDLEDVDAAIVKAQREIARPVAYRFIIRPTSGAACDKTLKWRPDWEIFHDEASQAVDRAVPADAESPRLPAERMLHASATVREQEPVNRVNT
jgi:hypothetical protein